MEERIRILNQKINNYIVLNDYDNNLVYYNLNLFLELSITLESILQEFYENIPKVNVDFNKINLFTRLKIIKSFYEKHNVKLDLEELINNGTIDFIESNIDEKPYSFKGINYYKNNHKLIDVSNNGYITDTLLWGHELSHFRNQTDYTRTQVGDLLTEALAGAEEYIMADYLENLGYNNILNWIKIGMFKFFYIYSKESIAVFKLFLLFKKLGNIDKSSYEMYYKNTNDYEEIINIAEEILNEDNFFLDIYAWYILDAYLSSYMYLEYKKDNAFYNKINLLHEKINSCNMLECLKIMGLNDLGDEDKEILTESVNEMVKCLINEKQKTKTTRTN